MKGNKRQSLWKLASLFLIFLSTQTLGWPQSHEYSPRFKCLRHDLPSGTARSITSRVTSGRLIKAPRSRRESPSGGRRIAGAGEGPLPAIDGCSGAGDLLFVAAREAAGKGAWLRLKISLNKRGNSSKSEWQWVNDSRERAMARYWTSSPTRAASYLAPTSPMLFFSARACASSCAVVFLLSLYLSPYFPSSSSSCPPFTLCVCVCASIHNMYILATSEWEKVLYACMNVCIQIHNLFFWYSPELQPTSSQLYSESDTANGAEQPPYSAHLCLRQPFFLRILFPPPNFVSFHVPKNYSFDLCLASSTF